MYLDVLSVNLKIKLKWGLIMSELDTFLLVCLAIFAVYFLIISVFAVHQIKRDKKLSGVSKSASSYWRIPESQLMLIAAMGGSFAMYSAMKKYRHKTKHLKFTLGIPVIMAMQIALFGFILWLRFFR